MLIDSEVLNAIRNLVVDGFLGGLKGIAALPAFVFSTHPVRREDDVSPPANGREYRQMAFGALIAFGLSAIGGLVGGYLAMSAKFGAVETVIRVHDKEISSITDRFNRHMENPARRER